MTTTYRLSVQALVLAISMFREASSPHSSASRKSSSRSGNSSSASNWIFSVVSLRSLLHIARGELVEPRAHGSS